MNYNPIPPAKPITSRNVVHNPSAIKAFYRSIKYSHFLNLSPERAAELDELVEKNRHFFETEIDGYGRRMTFASERLTTSSRNFGLLTGDEKIYFYIKMIDPDFLFLEAYESANTRDEFIAFCKKNFHIVDSVLAQLEKEANNRFQFYEKDELWSRDRIDKTIDLVEAKPRK